MPCENGSTSTKNNGLKVTSYTPDIELKMQRLYATLSEKDRRRYAAIEVAKLGHGGTEYISGLFSIDPKTIRQGMSELDLIEDPTKGRIRKKS